MDKALFHSQESEGSSQEETSMDFSIEGMTCASCVRRVEKAIQHVEGVKGASVNFTTEQARVYLATSAQQHLLAIQEAVEQAVSKKGYKAYYINRENPSTVGEYQSRMAEREQRDQAHLVWAIVFTIPLVLSMFLEYATSTPMLPGWIQFLLATPVQFWLGARFYKAGFRSIVSGSSNMDVLVALGSTAAWGLSTYILIKSFFGPVSSMGFYYESSALIITFILLGQWLEHATRRKAALSVQSLQSMRPAVVHVEAPEEPTGYVDRALAEVKVHDRLVVLPGDIFPVDGKVVAGSAYVDEAMLTGESDAVEKNIGDEVTEGTTNLDSHLVVEVLRLGKETRLAAIIRLIETAQASKAPLEKLVDRLSAVFVPIVIGVAVLTFLGWVVAGAPWHDALINAASVLVIACPCALGLATPTAFAAGNGAAARAGILIRDAEVMQEASQVGFVAFDKTGTLTEGLPGVVRICPIKTNDGEKTMEEGRMIHLMGSLSKYSEHPLSQALTAAALEKKVLLDEVVNFKVLRQEGRGVEGTINGITYIFGNTRLMNFYGFTPQELEGIGLSEDEENLTVSYLAMRSHDIRSKPVLLGAVLFDDKVRNEAQETLKDLKNMGIQTAMLTGDGKNIAYRIAKNVGLETVYAALSPEEKQEILQSLRQNDQRAPYPKIAMVGDGINDAPALAAADVGIAIASGTGAAVQAASVTLMRSDLLLVPDTLEISRLTSKRIRQGLFWAFVYNVIGIPLAASGALSPAVAGGAMALSSVCVVANASRLLRWKGKAHQYKGTPCYLGKDAVL
ncbi:heavy metal translocating P-type ATPase [Entomobacter blattae]|uniref:Copper-exporting P-type ATPase n=1 Tax=Entomobacter blattae TaxID=2762277 RepID=A0A7H1NPC5_9PROT|nr:heavy metal translocating P-type ATPase [Entomobacter blattae]QNT77635.1 Copper-exporting P-type ATPase [Entomobacter blattae]